MLEERMGSIPNEVKQARLCLVKHAVAYFTTQALSNQRGDDWDDMPYEHNAGVPYSPCWHRKLGHRTNGNVLCQCAACMRDWDGDRPRWMIVKVAFWGPFLPPWDLGKGATASLSVDQINGPQGRPWIRSCPDQIPYVEVCCGDSLEKFVRLIKLGGGTVGTIEYPGMEEDVVAGETEKKQRPFIVRRQRVPPKPVECWLEDWRQDGEVALVVDGLIVLLIGPDGVKRIAGPPAGLPFPFPLDEVGRIKLNEGGD